MSLTTLPLRDLLESFSSKEPVPGGGSAAALAEKLATGTWTHDYPIMAEEAKTLELPVSTDMPPEVYQFMSLFPQPTRTRPSVEYVPIPYRANGGRGRASG